ncbi:phosphohydrolase, partial [Candidatus Bipolaricaulota bacterium]|nr:phosphohydrolase [Candidatus Bipolaricaulota bacterium]
MRDKLIGILPEIEWIGDADLREKVIVTWIDGLERGGWTPDDVAPMPFTLAKKVSASFAQHVRSVTRICAA